MKNLILTAFLLTPLQSYAADTFDCSGPFGMAAGVSNGKHQFKPVMVEPGRCKWGIDKEADDYEAKEEAHRRALWSSLRTRPLTPEEIKEVAKYGTRLNVDNGVPYSASDKAEELQAALLTQQNAE